MYRGSQYFDFTDTRIPISNMILPTKAIEIGRLAARAASAAYGSFLAHLAASATCSDLNSIH